MAANGDRRTQNSLIAKLSKSNDLLWVTWQVKLGRRRMQHVVSKDFKHPHLKQMIWNLKLNLNPPSLVLQCTKREFFGDLSPRKVANCLMILEPDPVFDLVAADDEPLDMMDHDDDDGVDHELNQLHINLQMRDEERRKEHFEKAEHFKKMFEEDKMKFGENVFVTTLCDGQLLELTHKLSDRELMIPISTWTGEHIFEAGAVLTFKIEIRATNVLRDDKKNSADQEFLKTILQSLDFYDIQFKSIDGKSIKAHKLILSIVSPVIKARLLHDGDRNNVFETDFEFQSLKSWLDHIYRKNWIGDETKLDTIMNVFMVSDYFGTDNISKHCSDLIIERLSPNNLPFVIQHDMIYLSGDQAAKDVQDAILRIVDEISLGEIISKMDQDNRRLASFMSKILERTTKRKAEEAFQDVEEVLIDNILE